MKTALGVAVVLGLIGPAGAFAQGIDSSTTTRTTTSTVPSVENNKVVETRHGIDHHGNVVHEKRVYRNGANGSVVATKKRVITPEGTSRTTVREKQTEPLSGSSIEKQTTTTKTIDR